METLTGAGLDKAQGVEDLKARDLGWGWNAPTPNLVGAYEAGDCVRKDATILYSNQSDGDAITGGYGRLANLTNALYWNKKVYNQYSDYLAADSI